jgi:hypothetical protein
MKSLDEPMESLDEPMESLDERPCREAHQGSSRRLIKAHRSDQSRTERAERFVNDGQARTGPRTESADVHSYAGVC